MDDSDSPRQKPRKGFLRRFNKGRNGNAEEFTEEEFRSLVTEGHEQGIFKESEAEMINNISTLDEKEARDIMTHRKNMVSVDGSLTLGEVIAFAVEKRYSRYPVYLEDADNIIGSIHIKDLLAFSLKKDKWDVPITECENLVRTVPFIPETRNIDVLIKNMQTRKTHLVIVVDEYGQTSGLVTMEDILEEIVGNIQDEHDKEEPMIIPQADGSFLMDGMADFDEVCRLLGWEEQIPEDERDFDTLNGYIIAQIDRIPSEEEMISFVSLGYRFDIRKVENRMIRSVLVSRESHEDRE